MLILGVCIVPCVCLMRSDLNQRDPQFFFCLSLFLNKAEPVNTSQQDTSKTTDSSFNSTTIDQPRSPESIQAASRTKTSKRVGKGAGKNHRPSSHPPRAIIHNQSKVIYSSSSLSHFISVQFICPEIFVYAVVFWLFPKPFNQPQETVGYRLTLIQSSNLYFSLIHVILLEFAFSS